MTRQRIQLWFATFCIGLLGITSFSVSAQDDPIPAGSEALDQFLLAGNVVYVAGGTDGSTTDIYMMKLNDSGSGIETTNITNTPGINEIDPLFSPLGNRILYRGEADPTTYPGVNSLFVIDSDGLDNVQITPTGVNVFYGTFSPDGTQVAFMAQWGSREFKIYRSDINGENQFTLTPGDGFNAAFPLWQFDPNGDDSIAYIRVEGATSRIVAINPLTAEEVWSTDPVNQQWWILQPLYGEYGTFIMRENSDSPWNVATINLDTRDVTQITDNATNTCCLTMPVTYTPTTDANWTLMAQDSDTREMMPLTEAATSDLCTAWSDGTPITELDLALVAQAVNTGDTVPLTENEMDNFCAVWSVDGTITTDMAALGSAPAYYDFDDFSLVAQNTTTGETVPLNETMTAELCESYRLDTGDPNWRLVAQNSDTGEIAQLNENAINNFCEAWSLHGVVVTDMEALGSSPAYYLSDTEDGGRDIWSVNLDGSNPVNLTENDDREYTSVVPSSHLFRLVGYNEFESDTPTPRLGFTWDVPDHELQGNYELLSLTNGSDPDVVDPISLEQLEGFAAAGLLQSCALTVAADEITVIVINVYSEPSAFAPVARTLGFGDQVEVNGYLPGGLGDPVGWYHLSDGNWIIASRYLERPLNCPPLPTISRYTL